MMYTYSSHEYGSLGAGCQTVDIGFICNIALEIFQYASRDSHFQLSLNLHLIITFWNRNYVPEIESVATIWL